MPLSKSFTLKHHFDDENKVLTRSFYGKVNMKGIIDTWEADIKNNVVTRDLKAIINDFTTGVNIAEMSDQKDIAAFYNKNKELFRDIKIAVVLNARNVSISLFFERENPDHMHRSFATLEAAEQWSKE